MAKAGGMKHPEESHAEGSKGARGKPLTEEAPLEMPCAQQNRLLKPQVERT
jgi:hypothetical protein